MPAPNSRHPQPPGIASSPSPAPARAVKTGSPGAQRHPHHRRARLPTTESQQAFIDAFGRLYGGTQREVRSTAPAPTGAPPARWICSPKVTTAGAALRLRCWRATRIISVKQLTRSARGARLPSACGVQQRLRRWQLGSGSTAGSGDLAAATAGPTRPTALPHAAAQRDAIAPFGASSRALSQRLVRQAARCWTSSPASSPARLPSRRRPALRQRGAAAALRWF